MQKTDLSSDNKVKVWDFPTRIFHWTLVCLIILSWVTVENGWITLHLWAGMALCVLLLFRFVWGFAGSTTARFGDFVAGPQKIVHYLKDLLKANRQHHAGHNPAGGLMVVIFMAILGLQVATGLFANDELGFSGPFVSLVNKETSDYLTNMHSLLFNFILLLVWLHLVAIFFYFFVKGINLIKPMFTGKKDRADVPDDLQLHFTQPALALLILVLSGAFVGWTFFT